MPFKAKCIAERRISPLNVHDEVFVLGTAPTEDCEREIFVDISWNDRQLAVPLSQKDFPLFHPQGCFTDDSVLTIAVAKAILDDRNYLKAVWEIGRQYPHAGYGRYRTTTLKV
jgi:ADP-ribosylglycohydrolase